MEGRGAALALLALSNLLWAGNWIVGRALRDAFDPVTLNFWRWAVAALVIAPFTLPAVLAQWGVIRRHAGILLLLGFTGVALYQTLIYLGLRTTTAVNALLISSSAPLFILLCSWLIERERATARQVAGMLLSAAGIVVIVARGEPARLAQLELQAGDAWILAAMPVWGVYSVLLKRRPPTLGGFPFLFVISIVGVLMLAPLYALGGGIAPQGAWPSAAEVTGILYVAIAASVLGQGFWNIAVDRVGANVAGFTLQLLPVFGTLLAIVFLGEPFAGYHAAGFATILAGVLLATRR